ncbi:hypothetical protein NliqN6_2383 [Naganishia liquefaciens]|uniref:Uncharacterized protein n=1 Tax=Naganishia liquefaciens TaxID=104408 RepID=A0A8H3TRA0_9TREE|nr:hypothetical protein NliqN6_2383 [Naganishia liquefaciens]
MLLAQQTNNHMQRGVHPAQYYEERYQQPNIVYVDAFGRPMYEERFEIPYGNLHHEGEYYPVDTHGNVLPMGPLPAPEQYHEANVRLPRVDEQLPLHMHVPVAIEHQAMGREPQQALEARHVMPGQLPDQVMPYPSQVHVPQQWGPNPELLPFNQQAIQAPRQGPLKAQTGFVPEQDPATYALDPLLATNSRDFAVDAYGRVAQETSNHNAVDDFRNPPLPSDIIAGRWARDQNTTHENNLVECEHVNGDQAQQRNTDTLLPLMEGEQQLPSHHIDFGEKGELFGGDLNEVFPTDPDIEDYNAALHQQQDMETLLGQM